MIALRGEDLPVQTIMGSDLLAEVAEEMHYSDLDGFYAAIGDQHVAPRMVAQRVRQRLGGGPERLPVTARKPSRANARRRSAGVHVEGLDDMFVRLSKCCMPVPGDEIIGFMTRGRGVSVHRTDCPSAEGFSSRPDRVVEVEWDNDASGAFVVAVEVEALDRSRLLRDVAHTLAEHHVNILSCSSQTSADRVARFRFEFELADPGHLDSLVAALKRVDSVYDATRVMPGTARAGQLNNPRAAEGSPPRLDPTVSRDDLFRAPKGVHDVLPPESGRWTAIVARFAERARRYGYGLAITPMFEHIEVFQRVGEHTDVVAKEMYELTDKGGRRLGLRPEGTASVVRAYVQHRPTPPWKVWYVAPNFRYERAQKGRYRQHWQLGVEALGVEDPDIDVEVIALLAGFYRDLGLTRHAAAAQLDGRRRDPPRVTSPRCGRTSSRTAPRSARSSSRASRRTRCGCSTPRSRTGRTSSSRRRSSPSTSPTRPRRSSRRCRPGCARSASTFELAPRLVRGFDYYTATTFEFQSDALDARAERGRRWRPLRRARRGDGRSAHARHRVRDRPRADRARARGERRRPRRRAGTEVFVVDGLGGEGGTTVGGLVEALRTEGFAVDRAYGGRSVKAQWKAADRSGAGRGGDGRARRAHARRGRGEGPRVGRAGGGAPHGAGGVAGGPQRWRETVSVGPPGVIVR